MDPRNNNKPKLITSRREVPEDRRLYPHKRLVINERGVVLTNNEARELRKR